MLSTKEDLLETLNRIQEVPILVIGDIILDRYVWGDVDRISPEAPVPIVHERKTEDRLGGAGNVVRNLRGIGANVSLCGLIGDDDEGQRVLELLDQWEVEKEGVIIDRSRPTCLKTRVIAHSQQVVRIDREESKRLGDALGEGFAAVVDAQLDKSKVVIVSDYAKGAVSEVVMNRLEKAHEHGRIGLGVRPLVVDPKPPNYEVYKAISIATPNRREAEAATGMSITDQQSAAAAARKLIELWDAEMMLVTLGEDGLVIATSDSDQDVFLDTIAQDVYDVSGAGDTVVALFSAAMAAGATPQVAGDLANIGAGIVVSEVGTFSVTQERLRETIEQLSVA